MIVCVYIWGVGKDPPRIQRGKFIMDFIHCHSQISLSGFPRIVSPTPRPHEL